MKNLVRTDFDTVYDELDEIYLADFKSTNSGSYYHFYTDLYDLLNSLKERRIYSNKNKGAITQRDKTALEGEAYVCFTTEYEGKKWIAKQYKRPFGIAIDKADLESLCATKNYRFDPNVAYNQFGQKATCKTAKNGKVVFEDDHFSDFEIFAVGELSDGEYFISGGQGPSYSNLWPAQRFYNEELYKILRKWFWKNMHNAEHAKHYYHFKNDTIGKPIMFGKAAINSKGNLNKAYEPRRDTPKPERPEVSYDSSISFNIKHIQPFKEIIGIGPVKLYDEELNNIVLGISFIGAGATRGYPGPNLYGLNVSLNGFPKKSDYMLGKNSKYGAQYHLVTNEKTFKELCDIYNEHEHRVYIPDGKDFLFNAPAISTLVLPHDITSGSDYIDLQILANNIEAGELYELNVKDEELIKQLSIDGVLSLDTKKAMAIGRDTIKLVRGLLEILQSDYSNVKVEIISDISSKNKNDGPSFKKSDDEVIEVPTNRKVLKKQAHTRYVTEVEPIYSEAEIKIWKGIPSVLAPVEIWPGQAPEQARIGAETVVTGYDANNRKYVLFVDNAHKAENFLELPGGGLYKLPHGLSDLEEIALQRLHYKCGLDPKNKEIINGFRDSGKALLLDEKDVALDSNVTWPWSYYRLYQANYQPLINPDEVEFTHDNSEEAAEMGFEGYTANLRWVPVDSLEYNRSVKERYANIYNLIKNN